MQRADAGVEERDETDSIRIPPDRLSFTLMTPEGHTLLGWLTFSAHRDGDVAVVQIQAQVVCVNKRRVRWLTRRG